jgi:cytochrome P450
MNSCPLLMSVTSEVLRIVANPSSTRVVEEDTVVDGHLFRKGGMVMLPTSHLHSSPAWGDAAFDPDRFLNNPSLDKTSNGNYGPFGGGITYCPGRFLARQEIHMVVALMLDKYDMELVGGKASLPKKSTLKPTLGVFEPADTENIRVNVRRRA